MLQGLVKKALRFVDNANNIDENMTSLRQQKEAGKAADMWETGIRHRSSNKCCMEKL